MKTLNNELIPLTANADDEITMSSREIAELVNSRHDKVKQSIERLVERGVIVQPPMGDEHSTDSLGRPRSEKVYRIGKRDSYVIVAQLSPEFTARLVDRWQELEQNKEKIAVHALLSSPVHLLELAQGYAKQVIALTEENASMKADVDIVNRIHKADGSLCGTEAAKALQMRPKDLFSWLVQNGWFYKRTGSKHYLGYQSKVVAGYLEHKVDTVLRPDGTEQIREQVRITPKGLSRLAQVIKPALQVA